VGDGHGGGGGGEARRTVMKEERGPFGAPMKKRRSGGVEIEKEKGRRTWSRN